MIGYHADQSRRNMRIDTERSAKHLHLLEFLMSSERDEGKG